MITSADIAEIEDQTVHAEKLRDRITMQLYNSLKGSETPRADDVSGSAERESADVKGEGDDGDIYTKRQAKSPEFKPEEW